MNADIAMMHLYSGRKLLILGIIKEPSAEQNISLIQQILSTMQYLVKHHSTNFLIMYLKCTMLEMMKKFITITQHQIL